MRYGINVLKFIPSFCLIIMATVHVLDSYAAELPFSEGEKLTYEVRYKNLKVGESILTFHGKTGLGDREVYHITFSTKLVAVKDLEELYAQTDNFLPVEVHRRIKKARTFTTEIKEIYDQKNFRVGVHKETTLRSKDFSIQKDSSIHNAILLSYYYRTKSLFDKNEKLKVTLPTVDFEVFFEGEEVIETPLGEYLSYAFASNPPKFKLWLSADSKRIPLKIENPSALGYSLVIKSIEYR